MFCAVSGNGVNSPAGVACTDNNGSGTYEPIPTNASGEFFPTKQSDVDTMSCWVRTALMTNTTSTVITPATGSNTAGELVVVAISGATVAGSAAVKQWAAQSNQASGTPAPTFASACLTGNPTIGAVFNTANPAGLTPPTNWTERQDVGQSTPSTGLEVVTRDSGFTGTTVTWGSSSASAFCALILELDSSAGGGVTTVTTSDSLKLGLTEDRTMVGTLSRDESLALGLADASSLLALFASADSLAVGLLEVSTLAILLPLSSSDALTLGLTENSASIGVSLSTSDSLLLGLTELRTILATLVRDDTVLVGLTESASLLGTLQRGDTLLAGLLESSGIVDLLGGGPTVVDVTSSDTLRMLLTELQGGAANITHAYTVAGVEDSVGGSNVKTTGAFSSQVGDFVVVVGATYFYDWDATTPIDDSYGNTWTLLDQHDSVGTDGNQRNRVYGCILTAAGAGHTISIHASIATQFVMMVEAFRGTATSSYLDGSVVSHQITGSTSTAFAPGSITVAAGSLLLGWCVTDNSRSLTADAPQTKGSSVEGTGWYGGGINYDIKTVGGSFNPSWTLGVADKGWAGALAILPASSAVSSAQIQARFASSDLLPITVTDATTAMQAALTRDDTVALIVSEDRLLVVGVRRDDALPVGLTEVSATQAALSSSDALTVGVLEASQAILASLRRDDSLSLVITEDRVLLVTVSTTDTLAVVINEASAIVDLLGNLITKTSSDSLTVGLSEDRTLAVSVSTQENLPAGLLDATQSLLVALTRGDVPAVGLSESSTVQVQVSSAGDSLTVGLAEDRTLSVSLNSTAEALAIRITDATDSITVSLTRGESLGMGLTELSQAILAILARNDDLLVGVQEVADTILVSIANSSEQFSVIVIDASTVQARFQSADIIELRWTEEGVIALSSRFLEGVLITTATLVSPVRTVGGGSPTVRSMRALSLRSLFASALVVRTLRFLTPIRSLRVN